MHAAKDIGKLQPAGAAGVKSACAGTVEDSMAGPQNMRETPCDSSYASRHVHKKIQSPHPHQQSPKKIHDS